MKFIIVKYLAESTCSDVVLYTLCLDGQPENTSHLHLHSNSTEHKCIMLAWNKNWNNNVTIQWQRSNNPSWSAEENLYYCHKAFWNKVREHFIWKLWAVWNNNHAMWTDMVSPSWKYFCCDGISLLPHTFTSLGLVLLSHSDPCCRSSLWSSKRLRDNLWQGGQPHGNHPWAFA